MALTVTSNITNGATLTRQYDGTTLTERGSIIVNVGALTSVATPATALAVALNAAQGMYPRGMRFPGALSAVATAWTPVGRSDSDDVITVRVDFATIQLSFSPGTFVVSDSTSTENDTSQFLRNDNANPKILKQLTVPYDAPKAPAVAPNLVGIQFAGTRAIFLSANSAAANAAPLPKLQYVATVGYEKTMRRVILNTTFPKRNLGKFRAAVNCTNDAPWNGLPAFFWRIFEFDDTTVDLGNNYQIQLGAIADISKDVSKYAAGRDTSTGRIIAVDDNTLNDAQGKPYANDIIYQKNGLLRVGQYAPTSFSSLFGNF